MPITLKQGTAKAKINGEYVDLPFMQGVSLPGYNPVAKTAAMTSPVGKDLNGQLWTSVASDAQVAAACSDWLEDNVQSGTALTLDSTLLIEGSAADAKAAGDILRGFQTQVSTVQKEIDVLKGFHDENMTWQQIKDVVDSGTVTDWFSLGDQFIEPWKKTAESTAINAPWDVAHFYANGNMALHWHYAFPDAMPFDAPEAIYYADENGLAAGQYYISIGTAYSDGWSTSKHINFTLTAAMEEGDQLVINCGTDAKNDPTAGRTWNVYGFGSTTSKQSGVTSNSTDGTELGSTSSSGATYTNGNINAPQRVVYGYGRYKQSAIRQYINATAGAGEWWEPQNGWDRPPSQAATVRGWAGGFSSDFLSVVQPIEIVTAINTVEGSSSATETCADKFFLPSMTQMCFSEQYAEDEVWQLYRNLATEEGIASNARFANHPTTYDVIKRYNLEAQSSAVFVFLRSANRGYANGAWYVSTGGIVTNYYAYLAFRGCPACIIQKSST